MLQQQFPFYKPVIIEQSSTSPRTAEPQATRNSKSVTEVHQTGFAMSSFKPKAILRVTAKSLILHTVCRTRI